MGELAEKPGAIQRPHWSAAMASIIAMLSLWISEPKFLGLGALAAGVMLAYAVRFRLPRNPVVIWIVRAAVFAAIYLSAIDRNYRGSLWMLDPAYVNLFGYLCAAELAIQFWQKRKRPPSGEILVMSMLVFATASATYEQRWVRFLTPLYIIFVAISLRHFRARPSSLSTSPPRIRFAGMRWVAIALVLLFGAAGAYGLRVYGERVTIYPLHGIFKRSGMDMVGLSDSPRLGPSSDVQVGLGRVLRIEGPLSEAHLRALTFDTYESGNWLPPLNMRNFTRVSPHQLNAEAPGQRIRVIRLAMNYPIVLAPLSASGIRPDAETQIEWDSGRTLNEVGMPETLAPYDIVLGPSENHQGPLCAPITAEQRRQYLEVPSSIRPRIAELAGRIAGNGAPRQRIDAIEHYLLTNCKYSLNIPQSDGDPLCDFLFNRKTGHCQYFASAVVMLARCSGIPARFVNGFYAHEPASGGAIVVRQRDAHAWAEVWLDGVGWITVDATPDSGRPDGLFGPVGRWQRFSEWIADKWAAIKRWFGSLGWFKIAAGAGIAAGAASVLKWLYDTIRRWRPRRAAMASLYPEGDLASIAMDFDRLLRSLGLTCAANQTWSEHLARLEAERGRIDVPLASEFVALYQQARFGYVSPQSAIADLNEILRRLNDRNV